MQASGDRTTGLRRVAVLVATQQRFDPFALVHRVVVAETQFRYPADLHHEIDVERATRAKQRAEQRIAKGGEDIDYRRALVALERALIRIQVAGRRRHHLNQ